MTKSPQVIFFGNGPLADATLSVLKPHFDIIFHAQTREDLKTATDLKHTHPGAHGILASYGVLIPSSVLATFEPEGILNLHPSLLPLYRGPSPIESAILAGDAKFGVSIMKLAKAMDAGPVYYQTELSDLPLDKAAIYEALATAGAEWLVANLPFSALPTPEASASRPASSGTDSRPSSLPTPVAQDEDQATYTQKLTKKDGLLDPATETAAALYRKIIAFQGFPKAKIALYGQNCAILAAHPLKSGETAPLMLKGADGAYLSLDRVQPDGRKPMDAKSFLNGYAKKSA